MEPSSKGFIIGLPLVQGRNFQREQTKEASNWLALPLGPRFGFNLTFKGGLTHWKALLGLKDYSDYWETWKLIIDGGNIVLPFSYNYWKNWENWPMIGHNIYGKSWKGFTKYFRIATWKDYAIQR